MPVAYMNWVRRETERLDTEWRWASSPWGGLYELQELQWQGHITNLQYRYDRQGGMGEWVFRFKPTPTFTMDMLFNFTDYLPDQWEERRRWYGAIA